MAVDSSKLRQALGAWALEVTDKANDRMVDYARHGDAPRKTGELANDIRARNVVQHGRSYQGGLVASTIQAVTTDKGARPHLIRPRRQGGVLRFPSRGGIVFASVVNHPGNRAQHWWGPMHDRRWPRALRLAARETPF